MEMGGNFCQILELGGTTIKGRRVYAEFINSRSFGCGEYWREALIRGRRFYLCQHFLTYLKGVGKKSKRQLIFRSFC